MNIVRFWAVVSIAFWGVVSSCGNRQSYSIRVSNSKSIKLGDTLYVSLSKPSSKTPDSVVYYIDKERLPKYGDSPILMPSLKLGVQQLKGIVYSTGKVDTVSRKITILNNAPIKLYTCEVINTYPHDKDAYTQGLEFKNGILYESTGTYGKSTLRKVDYKTGKVVSKTDLDGKYFGEGITIVDDKIYQLTWQEKMGFIYDLDLKKQGSFYYESSKEGWGLCNNGSVIYKSDGTEKLWELNRETLAEEGFIQICSDKSLLYKTNELEFVDGKIYANTYLKDGIMIIDPKNGAVLGIIDCRQLKHKVTQHEQLDVLNGIAYNPETQSFFVTGKNWDKLFEVRFTENNP